MVEGVGEGYLIGFRVCVLGGVYNNNGVYNSYGRKEGDSRFIDFVNIKGRGGRVRIPRRGEVWDIRLLFSLYAKNLACYE